MIDYDIQEKIYFHELSRRNQLLSTISVPAAIFMAISAIDWKLTSYLLSNISDNAILPLIFCVITLSISGILANLLYKIISPEEYAYLPDPKIINDTGLALIEYHNKVEDVAKNDLRSQLLSDIVECNCHNKYRQRNPMKPLPYLQKIIHLSKKKILINKIIYQELI